MCTKNIPKASKCTGNAEIQWIVLKMWPSSYPSQLSSSSWQSWKEKLWSSESEAALLGIYWEERKRETQYYPTPFLEGSRYCVKTQCPVLWTFFWSMYCVNGNNKTHFYFSKCDGVGWFSETLFCVSNRLYGVTVTQGAVHTHIDCLFVHSLHNLKAFLGIAPFWKSHFFSCSALLFCTSLAWNHFHFFWPSKFL